MQFNGLLLTLPKELKYLIGVFLLVLSLGFYSGISMVNMTSSMSPQGIEENYIGNETDENAIDMKFQKSEQQVIGIIHSHILSMSMLFFLLGVIMFTTQLHRKLKMALIIEPFLSIILTFGGIYMLWKGFSWFKYIVILSGILMVLTYTISIIIIYYQLLFSKTLLKSKD
ncbi:MAG: hypothetical protein OEL54_04795 [Flavobacteriaceae bacterium]|nr:hypothetical protein [Flavobacteriaceae bacterium]